MSSVTAAPAGIVPAAATPSRVFRADPVRRASPGNAALRNRLALGFNCERAAVARGLGGPRLLLLLLRFGECHLRQEVSLHHGRIQYRRLLVPLAEGCVPGFFLVALIATAGFAVRQPHVHLLAVDVVVRHLRGSFVVAQQLAAGGPLRVNAAARVVAIRYRLRTVNDVRPAPSLGVSCLPVRSPVPCCVAVAVAAFPCETLVAAR